MSSLVRRIQKRIAKDMGYHRDRSSGLVVDSDGEVCKYGLVVTKSKDRDGNEIVTTTNRWPQVKAPTKEKADG